MPVERIVPTASRVVVEIDGTVVADSTTTCVLHETGLPPRYYIPPADVRLDLLTATDTSTHCPYKGDARYWTAMVGDTDHRDIVWAYEEPIADAAAITGLLSFYPERTTITVDGTTL